MTSTIYASSGHCDLCYLGPWRVLEKNLYTKKKFQKLVSKSLMWLCTGQTAVISLQLVLNNKYRPRSFITDINVVV